MTKPRSLPASHIGQAKPWTIPVVKPHPRDVDEEKTNLLNRKADWVYEPPEEVPEILPPTAEEIEAIRQAAYEEGLSQGKAQGYAEGHEEGLQAGRELGYNEGYATGEQAGMDTGKIKVEALAEQWQQLVSNIHAPLQQVNDTTREQLTLLAVNLARAVILSEVKTNHDVILQALSEGMKALPINERAYQIHLHPEDLRVVETHVGAEALQQRGWQLIESPGVVRGGCDIVTDSNAVDVTLERRLRQVLDQFLVNQGVSDA